MCGLPKLTRLFLCRYATIPARKRDDDDDTTTNFFVRVIRVLIGDRGPWSAQAFDSATFLHTRPNHIWQEKMAVDASGAVLMCTTTWEQPDTDDNTKRIQLRLYPMHALGVSHLLLNIALPPQLESMDFLRLDQESRPGVKQLAFFVKYKRPHVPAVGDDADPNEEDNSHDDNAIVRFSI